jgi:hypothetical protein
VLLAVSGLVPPGAVPTTLVLDKQGRVASRVLGEIQKGTLKALITSLPWQSNGGALTVNSPFAEAILNGSLLLAIPVALLAGFVSFLSPCVLPLVPGYLGYVTGLTGVDLEKQKRGRMLAGIGLFVLGFSVIFVLLGGAFGQLGFHDQRRAELVGHPGPGRSGDHHGRGVHGRLSAGFSGTPRSTPSRLPVCGVHRCWASPSAWAGRRASGRPIPRCSS